MHEYKTTNNFEMQNSEEEEEASFKDLETIRFQISNTMCSKNSQHKLPLWILNKPSVPAIKKLHTRSQHHIINKNKIQRKHQ